jgi:hypothetical protein
MARPAASSSMGSLKKRPAASSSMARQQPKKRPAAAVTHATATTAAAATAAAAIAAATAAPAAPPPQKKVRSGMSGWVRWRTVTVAAPLAAQTECKTEFAQTEFTLRPSETISIPGEDCVYRQPGVEMVSSVDVHFRFMPRTPPSESE